MSGEIDEPTRRILCTANPFDEVARPQHPDGRFLKIHVESVLQEPRELLLAAIDAYRVSQYRSLVDLPPSRVVKVLGDRGAGKTHLLEAVLHRPDRRPQLLVCRETDNFDEGMPFEEYLFQLLMRSLLSRHPDDDYQFFAALAGHLTRKLLGHTLRELGPTDRLFVFSRSSWQELRLLWHGGESISRRFDELANELDDSDKSTDLSQLVSRYQLDPVTLGELTLARLARCEPGEDVPSIIRRELYGAMVRSALLGDREALQGFLEADYQPPSRGRTLYRADVVRHLLHAVVEACAQVRLPVVIAFDNLEGLLAPSGSLRPQRAVAFLDGLAQAVDHTRGLLFLLFFEQGLYLAAQQATGTFARSRLDLGVEVPGRRRIGEMELQPPTKEEVCALIKGRMKPIRELLPDSSLLPDIFPFSPDFIERCAALKGQPIRGNLEALRAEYDRLAFGPPVAPRKVVRSADDELMTDPERHKFLERTWEESLSEAGRALELSLPAQHRDLARGLGLLLQMALPWPEEYPVLEEASSALTVGDDPRYGFATLLTYTRSPVRVAVGFLLALGRGMPLDLQAKLTVFSDDKVRADYLIVLWPTGKRAEDLASVLPGKTQEVWQKARKHHPACLRVVELTCLRKILAFVSWQEKVRQLEAAFPSESVKSFVRQRFAEVFPLVRPPNLESK